MVYYLLHTLFHIEYCSYKGLTLTALHLHSFRDYIEYCSYKGLTQSKLCTINNKVKIRLNIVLIKD